MKDALKLILSTILKSLNSKDDLIAEIEYRKKDLNSKLDRATVYSTELDKMLFKLAILIFGAIIFGFRNVGIKANWLVDIFFISFMISIIFLFVSLFFAKWQKQTNINLQNKYIKWLEKELEMKKPYEVSEKENKKDDKDNAKVKKLGVYIEKFSEWSYVGFLLTGFLFMHILMLNIDKIR